MDFAFEAFGAYLQAGADNWCVLMPKHYQTERHPILCVSVSRTYVQYWYCVDSSDKSPQMMQKGIDDLKQTNRLGLERKSKLEPS